MCVYYHGSRVKLCMKYNSFLLSHSSFLLPFGHIFIYSSPLFVTCFIGNYFMLYDFVLPTSDQAI